VKTVRSAAVAALVGSMLVAGASPALAAESDDATPPKVTILGLTPGQVVPQNFRLDALITDDVGVKTVDVIVNGTVYFTLPLWMGRVGIYFPSDLDGKDATVTLRAHDAAGNSGEASATVRVDASAPKVTLTPAPGSSVAGVITITADVSPDTASLTLLEGATGTPLAKLTGKPWTFTWNTAGQADAPYLRAEDASGNESTIYTGYVVDNEAPVISGPTFVYQVQGQRVQSAVLRMPRKATLSASILDESAVSRIEWWSNGVKIGTGDTITWDAGAATRTATVEIRAWDAAGNNSSRSFAVQVDTTGPVIKSITPANRALVRGSHVLSAVSATDPSGIWVALPADTAADYKTPYSAVFPVTVDGARTLTWTVVDALGNATTASRVVVVDNTRPKLTITKAPKNGAKVKGTVKVSASASDKNGVNRVELLINGKVVAKDTTAGYNFSINTSKYGKKLKVQLRAYDKAGNAIATSTRTWHR
jgi:hypothetical protein